LRERIREADGLAGDTADETGILCRKAGPLRGRIDRALVAARAKLRRRCGGFTA